MVDLPPLFARQPVNLRSLLEQLYEWTREREEEQAEERNFEAAYWLDAVADELGDILRLYANGEIDCDTESGWPESGVEDESDEGGEV